MRLGDIIPELEYLGNFSFINKTVKISLQLNEPKFCLSTSSSGMAVNARNALELAHTYSVNNLTVW